MDIISAAIKFVSFQYSLPKTDLYYFIDTYLIQTFGMSRPPPPPPFFFFQDQYANSIMHDVNMTFRVLLHKMVRLIDKESMSYGFYFSPSFRTEDAFMLSIKSLGWKDLVRLIYFM